MVYISRTGLTTTSVIRKLAWVICLLYLEMYLFWLRLRGLRAITLSEYNRQLGLSASPPLGGPGPLRQAD